MEMYSYTRGYVADVAEIQQISGLKCRENDSFIQIILGINTKRTSASLQQAEVTCVTVIHCRLN